MLWPSHCLAAPNENIWIVLHITHLKLCEIVNHSW